MERLGQLERVEPLESERPGRAHDLGALRDFERLAREFVTDLRTVAWDSSSVLGSEVIPALRDILADTLDRIRTEIIGPLNTPGSPDAPPGDDSGSKDWSKSEGQKTNYLSRAGWTARVNFRWHSFGRPAEICLRPQPFPVC